MSSAPQIDHIVLLLPYALVTSPPEWLTSAFTISPGGRHADNRTENRLILFADGSYLELIAFINDDPEKREGHWWVSALNRLKVLKWCVHDLTWIIGQAIRHRGLGSDLNHRRGARCESHQLSPRKSQLCSQVCAAHRWWAEAARRC